MVSGTSFPNPPVGIASNTFSPNGEPTNSILLLFPVSGTPAAGTPASAATAVASRRRLADAAADAVAAAAGAEDPETAVAAGAVPRRRLADVAAAAAAAREVSGSNHASPLSTHLRSLLDAVELAGPAALRRRVIAEGDPSGLLGAAVQKLKDLVQDQRLVIASTGKAVLV